MKFENNVTPPPSVWSIARDHLPVFLVGGGAIAVFLGLHTAASGVVVIAALHLIAGLAAVATQQLRKSRQPSARADQG